MTETLVQKLIDRSPLTAPAGRRPWPKWAAYLFWILFTLALPAVILAAYLLLPATQWMMNRMFRHRMLRARKPRRKLSATAHYLVEYRDTHGVMTMPEQFHGGYSGVSVVRRA